MKQLVTLATFVVLSSSFAASYSIIGKYECQKVDVVARLPSDQDLLLSLESSIDEFAITRQANDSLTMVIDSDTSITLEKVIVGTDFARLQGIWPATHTVTSFDIQFYQDNNKVNKALVHANMVIYPIDKKVSPREYSSIIDCQSK